MTERSIDVDVDKYIYITSGRLSFTHFAQAARFLRMCNIVLPLGMIWVPSSSLVIVIGRCEGRERGAAARCSFSIRRPTWPCAWASLDHEFRRFD